MSTDSVCASEAPNSPNHRAHLAAQFGWTMAEVFGRLRQPILWEPTLPEAPRLFLSHFKPTNGETLWAETCRLLHLANLLFEEDELARPAAIVDLVERMECRIQGMSSPLPAHDDLYSELNRWSRHCWARLDGENALLAEAASLAASLADTWWHMQPPFDRSESASGETWRDLLRAERLNRLIRSVRWVEFHLPQAVGRVIRHSLWEWAIPGELVRRPTGEIGVAYPLLYALRRFNLIRKWRRRLINKQHMAPPQLSRREKKAIWSQLRQQQVIWKRLLFDRSIDQLLRPSDWRGVRWISGGLYAILGMVVVIGGTLAFFYLVRTSQQVLGWLGPRTTTPAEVQEWLALGSALISVLGFLIVQLRRGAEGFHSLYRAIYEWVLACKMDQRTLRAWNGKEKPVLLIVLQRLMHADGGAVSRR